MSAALRLHLHARQLQVLRRLEPDDERLKEIPLQYHSIFPLDHHSKNRAASGSYGYPSAVFKVRKEIQKEREDGRTDGRTEGKQGGRVGRHSFFFSFLVWCNAHFASIDGGINPSHSMHVCSFVCSIGWLMPLLRSFFVWCR